MRSTLLSPQRSHHRLALSLSLSRLSLSLSLSLPLSHSHFLSLSLSKYTDLNCEALDCYYAAMRHTSERKHVTAVHDGRAVAKEGPMSRSEGGGRGRGRERGAAV